MNKNDLSVSPQDDVRTTSDAKRMQAITIAKPLQQPSYREFRHCLLGLDQRHLSAALAFRQGISSRHQDSAHAELHCGYDNQTLENLQAAAAKLEAGKEFAPATAAHTKPISTRPRVKTLSKSIPTPLPAPQPDAPNGDDRAAWPKLSEGAPAADSGTLCQVFVKNALRKPRSTGSDRALEPR